MLTRPSQLKPQRQWLFPFCNWAYRGTLKIFADMRVENRQFLDVQGPVIVVCNHLSNLDPPTVASVIPRLPLFMAKRELFSNPVFRFLLRGWGGFPVSRDAADLRALNWARAMLKAQRLIVLFPEGTRSRNMEGLKRGQIGAALIASESGATVVPMAIQGSESMQNVLRVLMPIAKIRISVGEPFTVSIPSHDRESLRLATDELMARIALQLPEERRGRYRERAYGEFKYTSSINRASDEERAADASSLISEGGG